MAALLLKPRSWIAPYVALWIGVGLLPFQPTDLDIFFWPSAKIAVHGHPFSVYAAGGHALYPNANGPVSLLPLSALGVVLNWVGWLDATAARRGIALGVFCIFVILMAREAVAAIERLRGTPLIPSVRLLVYATLTLSPLVWQSVAGYGHIEQPIEIWLLLVAARWLGESRPLRAGIAFGASILTRSPAVLMSVPLGIAGWRQSRRSALMFFFGAGAAGAAIVLPFLVADPSDVIHSLLTYRGSLKVGAGSVWSLARDSSLETAVQHYDIVLVVAAVLATNLWLARGNRLDEGRLFAGMALTSAAFAMLAKTVWPYYFLELYILGSVWAFGTWRPQDGVVRLVLLPIAVSVFGLIAEIGSEQYLPLTLARTEGAAMFVMLALMIAWIMRFATREPASPAGIATTAVRLKGHGPERADESAG
ncbi:MAG: hypothetical protein E6I39_09120 [Chloroflexi bacterium]|nr:MAG: hypothetical protein E6I39_09120 [Chloroflexota bacterium]